MELCRRILVVEDDKKLNDGICLALKAPDRIFFSCPTLGAAEEVLRSQQISLILLDVNLPDVNGIQWLERLRKSSQIPVILITVNNLELDIVTGLGQ